MLLEHATRYTVYDGAKMPARSSESSVSAVRRSDETADELVSRRGF